MLAKVHSAVSMGFDSALIEIESDTANSLPGIVIVGLASKSIDEAKERIRSALKNSSLPIPAKRFTVNLAPANIPKDGTGFDLAIAVAMLISSGQVSQTATQKMAFCGELSLDGALKPVYGTLSHVKMLTQAGFTVVLSPQNAEEAALIKDAHILTPRTLKQLYRHLINEETLLPFKGRPVTSTRSYPVDMADIAEQPQAKRALQIAAAGGHNVLMNGPPGSGKTMLAKAFAGILPDLSHEEIVEVTLLHSLAGQNSHQVVRNRPFRAPHHTTSSVALIGGGTKPKPGEVSLSNHGVLFLDELPEYNRSVVEALRQPLEDGEVTVSRASGHVKFPARFTMIATKNPCPCGFLTDPEITCSCSAAQIERYRRRLSGPLLDRFDIVLEVARIPSRTILGEHQLPSSHTYKEVVEKARATQLARFQSHLKLNSHMSNADIKKLLTIEPAAQELMNQAAEKMKLSARSYVRTLKVACTIADLESSPKISSAHVAEALQYRHKELTSI